MFGKRAAVIGRDRGTTKTQTDPPVLIHENQYEGIKPTGERFAISAKALVDAAAVVVAQKHTGAVGPMIERDRSEETPLPEEGKSSDGGIVLPTLLLDPPLLFRADGHFQLP